MKSYTSFDSRGCSIIFTFIFHVTFLRLTANFYGVCFYGKLKSTAQMMQNWHNNKLGFDAVWRSMWCNLYGNETRKKYHIANDKETQAKSKHDACQLVNQVTVQTTSVH